MCRKILVNIQSKRMKLTEYSCVDTVWSDQKENVRNTENYSPMLTAVRAPVCSFY